MPRHGWRGWIGALVLLPLLVACGGTQATAPPAGSPPAATVARGGSAVSGVGAAVGSAPAGGISGTTTSSVILSTPAAPFGTPAFSSTNSGAAASVITTQAVANAPTVHIDTPQEGATVPGPNVAVTFHSTNITIAPANNALTPGVAHYFVVLDETLTLEKPEPSDATHIQTANTHVTLTGVAPGKHIIRVALVDGQGRPLPNPQAQASINITVT